ncbi:MAG: response regulator [Flavobacteriaceae bacterium]|nr:response regulator [Flavobacteriaceae bacterium]
MNLNLLLVEDDEIEIMKFSKVLNKLKKTCKISIAKNGEEALAIARKTIPNLILLDLSMPKMCGLEVLENIRSEVGLSFIPTVILTTSNNHRDMLAAYNLGVAGYFVKPLRYEAYALQIEKIINYWSDNEFVK